VGVAWPADNPMAAVSVAAISSRLDLDRRVEVAAVLQRQALRLTRMLAGLEKLRTDMHKAIHI
jgi:DNA-binding IclR family transcriptional regulator